MSDTLDEENIRRLAESLANGPAFDSKYFRLWQKYGFHILPNHFYQPIPDLSKPKGSLWDGKVCQIFPV
jgi:hypothetical protein